MLSLHARVKANMARALDIDTTELVMPAEFAADLAAPHDADDLLAAAEMLRLIADTYEAHAALLP